MDPEKEVGASEETPRKRGRPPGSKTRKDGDAEAKRSHHAKSPRPVRPPPPPADPAALKAAQDAKYQEALGLACMIPTIPYAFYARGGQVPFTRFKWDPHPGYELLPEEVTAAANAWMLMSEAFEITMPLKVTAVVMLLGACLGPAMARAQDPAILKKSQALQREARAQAERMNGAQGEPLV